MKPIAMCTPLVAAFTLIATSTRADDTGWHVSAGPGVFIAPEYPGSKDEEVLPIPAIDIAYGGSLFFNSRRGLGVYLVNDGQRQFGGSLWFRRGRDHRDGERIAALDDIDDHAVAQMFFTQNLGPITLNTTVTQAITENTGLTLEGSAAWTLQLTPATRASVGTQASFGNDKHMRTWFGITPTQARASGLAEHSINAGLKSIGGFASISYDLSPVWTVAAFLTYDVLAADAADSPVVERDEMPALGMSVLYRFGQRRD